MSIDVSSSQTTTFPVAFFLDSESYHPIHEDQLNPAMPIPAEVLSVLETSSVVQSTFRTYMLDIHSWLPILSEKRLHERLNRFDESRDMDFALLFLCMKLVSETPSDDRHCVTNSIYYTAKGFYTKVERTNTVSIPPPVRHLDCTLRDRTWYLSGCILKP